MKRPGRKSDEEKKSGELVLIENHLVKGRPEPPDDLNEQQAKIWTATVRDEPLEHFSTEATQQMLKDYCVHRWECDRIISIISDFPAAGLKNKIGLKHYHGMSRMLELHSSRAASLATKLRLTNQSRYTPMAAATASRNTYKGDKPWDWDFG